MPRGSRIFCTHLGQVDQGVMRTYLCLLKNWSNSNCNYFVPRNGGRSSDVTARHGRETSQMSQTMIASSVTCRHKISGQATSLHVQSRHSMSIQARSQVAPSHGDGANCWGVGGEFGSVRFLAVCFLYKTNPSPRKIVCCGKKWPKMPLLT